MVRLPARDPTDLTDQAWHEAGLSQQLAAVRDETPDPDCGGLGGYGAAACAVAVADEEVGRRPPLPPQKGARREPGAEKAWCTRNEPVTAGEVAAAENDGTVGRSPSSRMHTRVGARVAAAAESSAAKYCAAGALASGVPESVRGRPVTRRASDGAAGVHHRAPRRGVVLPSRNGRRGPP